MGSLAVKQLLFLFIFLAAFGTFCFSDEYLLAEQEVLSLQNIAIQALKIVDLTGQGCLGGPRGCPDRVDLKITSGAQTKDVSLLLASTTAQKEKGVNRVQLFGIQIALLEIRKGRIKLQIKSVNQ